MTVKKITIASLSALCLLILFEISLRILGFIDFPLYKPGPPYGYIPAPSQAGAFLNKNTYAFNRLSMGTASEFAPSAGSVDTLLVGDSVVYGGNAYRQKEKLGPVLAEALGAPVWPISAGSWSLANELIYFEHNPSVVQNVDRIVFILNSEDLNPPSAWKSEITHPTHRPTLATLYLLGKFFPLPHREITLSAEYITWKPLWNNYIRNAHPETFIFLYPTKDEERTPTLRVNNLVEKMEQLSAKNVRIVDIGADKRWNTGMYKDDIHPSPKGTLLLSKIIADNVESNTQLARSPR